MKDPIKSIQGYDNRETVFREELVTYRSEGDQITQDVTVRVYSDLKNYEEIFHQFPLDLDKNQLDTLKKI